MESKIKKIVIKPDKDARYFQRLRNSALSGKDARPYINELERLVAALEQEVNFFAGAALVHGCDYFKNYLSENVIPDQTTSAEKKTQEILCRNVTITQIEEGPAFYQSRQTPVKAIAWYAFDGFKSKDSEGLPPPANDRADNEDHDPEDSKNPVQPRQSTSREAANTEIEVLCIVDKRKRVSFRLCSYGGCNFFEPLDQRNYATHWRRHHPEKPFNGLTSFKVVHWAEEEYPVPKENWGIQKCVRRDPFVRIKEPRTRTEEIEACILRGKKLCREGNVSWEDMIRKV